jgi:O-antigen ligase
VVLANGLMGGLVAAFGLVQAIGHRAGWTEAGSRLFRAQSEAMGPSGYLRPTSVFLEPAWLGGYLAFALAALFGLLASGTLKRWGSRTIAIAALIAVLLCLLATVSWGAYADLAVVLAAGLWLLRDRFRAAPKAAAVIGAVLVLVLAVGALSPPGRAAATAALQRWKMLLETPVGAEASAREVSDSSWMRFENARHTIALIREYPGRGVGLGQFGRYARTSGTSSIAVASTRDPWCGWLAIAAEVGLLGPPALAAFLVAVFLRRSGGTLPGPSPDDAFRRVTVPALVLLALVQQAHTGSYIDLWWWYPLSVAMLLAAPSADPPPAILVGGR